MHLPLSVMMERVHHREDGHIVEDLLGIAGLRIQRMPSEPDAEFGNPANYPYMCVASPSCHDTSTTRAWYEEDADRRQRFYNNVRLFTKHPFRDVR